MTTPEERITVDALSLLERSILWRSKDNASVGLALATKETIGDVVSRVTDTQLEWSKSSPSQYRPFLILGIDDEVADYETDNFIDLTKDNESSQIIARNPEKYSDKYDIDNNTLLIMILDRNGLVLDDTGRAKFWPFITGDFQAISNHKHNDTLTAPLLIIASSEYRDILKSDTDLWHRLGNGGFGIREIN